MMSKKKTKTSFKYYSYIPIEILTLILTRLPGKTLLRFMSVCKSWCSIIDDPGFIHLHHQLSNMNNNRKKNLFVAFESGKRGLMTIRRADTLRKTGHNLTTFKNYAFSGNCNGLLLMWRYVDKKQELILWNPSIRKSLLIPPCPIPSHLHRETTAFVFGFAPSTKEHKILAFTLDRTMGTRLEYVYFAVYTLSDQRWTIRKNGFNNVKRSCFSGTFYSYSNPSNTVFFHKTVHSIGSDSHNDTRNYLISLDFDSEKFTFLKLPYFPGHIFDRNRFLFILGESLAIFCISKVYTKIWVLEDDDGKRVWTLWFSRPSTRDEFDLFSYHKYSNAFYYESDDGGCLIIGKDSYNIASGKVQKRGKSMRKRVELETYYESLVLHKGYGAQYDDDVFPVVNSNY